MEVLRDNTLEARVRSVGKLYDARMIEITQNLRREPADVRFCRTCVLVNKWPIDVSGMSAEEYQTHMRGDLDEASGLLEHNWDPRHTGLGFLNANPPAARRWFCTIDTRVKCHACGLGFDLVHVFDPSGDDTFPEERKAAADEHRAFCPIREVDGWKTDVTQTYHVGDYQDRFVDAANRGDDIMSIVGEDYYDEFIRPRLSRARIATTQRYLNRKALASQVLLKHCPKCLRASSTTLMGKRMHERVCQLTRFDWVTLAEVQPLRAREGIDGREMVMNSNGSLEGRFRILAPGEKTRLERKYQQQLYTRLNMDEKSLTLLGDDNDSEDVPSEQDGDLIPRRRGPRRRRPRRRPINSENSDDENDYGPGRGGGRIAHRGIPTLEEYNKWHAAMAPTLLRGNNNSAKQVTSRFQMGFQEMLQKNDPLATGVPAPQAGFPPAVLPLVQQRVPRLARKTPKERVAPVTGETGVAPPQTGPGRAAPGSTRPDAREGDGPTEGTTHGGAGNVGGDPRLGTKIPALREADTERPLNTNPTPELQRAFDALPGDFVSAVTETGLLDGWITFSWKLTTLHLLLPTWSIQNARAAEMARKGKARRVAAAFPDGGGTLEMYVDFFTNGGLMNTPRPRTFLEILRYTDARLDSDHPPFQILFPTETMPDGFREQMGSDQALSACFMLGLRRIMAFWGFESRGLGPTGRPLWRLSPSFVAPYHGWTHQYNHNHLRITRVIRSLRLVGAPRAARSIYRCIMRAVRERHLPVNEGIRKFWRRAALGPLDMDPLAKGFPPDAKFRTDSEPEEDEETRDLRPGNLDGNNDGDQEGPEGGATGTKTATTKTATNKTAATKTSTTDNRPAPRKEQARAKRPNESNDVDDGTNKRQRLQPAGDAPVSSLADSPGSDWNDWNEEVGASEPLRGTDRGENHPTYHNDGGPGEDLYAIENSSSSEGFLDPHERDEDFIPQRLPFSPIEPHPREAGQREGYIPPTQTTRVSTNPGRAKQQRTTPAERARLEELGPRR